MPVEERQHQWQQDIFNDAKLLLFSTGFSVSCVISIITWKLGAAEQNEEIFHYKKIAPIG